VIVPPSHNRNIDCLWFDVMYSRFTVIVRYCGTQFDGSLSKYSSIGSIDIPISVSPAF
jgi:hypothetical protein